MVKRLTSIVLTALAVCATFLPLRTVLAAGSILNITGATNFNAQSTTVLQTVKNNTKLGGYDNVAASGPIETVSYIINFLLGLLGTIALALTVYAGFVWLKAQGNEEEVTRAKNILIGSVTGILLVLSSYAIINYVFRSFVNITN